MRQPTFEVIPAIILMGTALFTVSNFGQNSDFNLNVHAKSNVTAKDIGLPVYPGATPFKEKDSDSSSADFLFWLNSFHLSVKAASFVTTGSPDHVLESYRKPLARFGEVLECDHGKPVGSLTATKSGLTCGDPTSGRMGMVGSGSDRELRAGTPEQSWIVAVDGAEKGKTKFGLVALVLPKDEDTK